MGIAIHWVLGILVDDEFSIILSCRNVQDFTEDKCAHKNQVVLSTVTETCSQVEGKAISS